MTQVISSVLYRIANRKRSMVVHHDSLKLCSDGDLLIWLCWNKVKITAHLVRSLDCDTGDIISIVSYC